MLTLYYLFTFLCLFMFLHKFIYLLFIINVINKCYVTVFFKFNKYTKKKPFHSREEMTITGYVS